MTDYEVTWGVAMPAESPEDAVRQALGLLEHMLRNRQLGPNVFLTRCLDSDPDKWHEILADEVRA